MFFHNIDPVLLKLGFLEIRYYSLVYIIGFFVGLYFLNRERKQLGISKEEVYDFTFYLMLGVILGSRLFMYIWEPSYYFSDFFAIFRVWEGGMSVHGGMVGAILAGYIYCKVKKISFLRAGDILAWPLMFVLGLGRIANFINGELWGTKTDVSWCFMFEGVDGCRHPYQFYNAFARFVSSGILAWMYFKRRFKKGVVFFTFIVLESLGRIFCDFYREGFRFWSLTVGQWMSVIMLFVGLYFLYWANSRKSGLDTVKENESVK